MFEFYIISNLCPKKQKCIKVPNMKKKSITHLGRAAKTKKKQKSLNFIQKKNRKKKL